MSDKSDIKPAPFAQPEAAVMKDERGGGESGDVQSSVDDLNLDGKEAAREGQEKGSGDMVPERQNMVLRNCPSFLPTTSSWASCLKLGTEDT